VKLVFVVCFALLGWAGLDAGELSRRERLSSERVLAGGPPRYDLDFLLADLIPKPGRRFTEFSGDLSGRYLEALARTGAIELARPLEAAIFGLQRPDGGFANPLSSGSGVEDDDMARVWGHGRLLTGLLAAYEEGGDAKALAAARGLGDFLVRVAPRFQDEGVVAEFSSGKLAHGYICWTQNLEGLAALYQATEEPRYLELAQAVAERVRRHPNQHSHGWLSSLRGLVALAEVSGDARILQQAETAWQELVDSGNVLPTGTIPEYFLPGMARDEGCSQADWVRLNLELWRRTENARYLEAAERAVFNAFFLNQFPSGDFGHMELVDDGLGYGTSSAWWCCTLHGLRAFPAIRQAAFREAGGALRYELPVDGSIRARGLQLRASAELAQLAAVRFEVVGAPSEAVRLEIRRPAWSGELVSDLAGETSQDGLRFERVWRTGEAFAVQYDPLERRDGGRLFLGPWLLAVSEAASPRFFDEPHQNNRVDWDSLAAGDRPSRRTVEYIPAGYPGQRQTVVLRPPAERIEGADGLRWQWKFADNAGWLERKADRIAEQSRGRIAPFLAGILVAAIAFGFWSRRRRR